MTSTVASPAAALPPGAFGLRAAALYVAMAGLILATGASTGWNYALTIVNMGLVSAILALGVNLQWGYAGLFNVGVMGFVALGGLATVLVGMAPVADAWAAGGPRLLSGLAIAGLTVAGLVALRRRMPKGRARAAVMAGLGVLGIVLARAVLDPAVLAVEAVTPASTGYLGGLGAYRILSVPGGGIFAAALVWLSGGLLAAGAAWVIGKTALGLRSDYLAIATLGIAEIILAILKNEDWLARGVKNVQGIPSPVPQAIRLQEGGGWWMDQAATWGFDPVTASTTLNKMGYTALFATVLVVLFVLSQLALRSPWGRMVRAIRDNEVAAEAMGKDVTARHLQIFVLGSAICGIAGAMMTTLDGQFLPGSYQPLRHTFLIWVMVLVGGSGSNWGAVLGGFFIWWLYVVVAPISQAVFGVLAAALPEGSWLALRLADSGEQMRLLVLGVLLLAVLRFSPRGLIPER